ncbi:hypothetical protein L249_1891 [Ophiocordyceps polyrhachis-furcata BCC 54312]|uniref:UBX domain-containing protein n=1 Tax=Ophiocordyceps polyrhachis-furcata BCC 54312 TaxID=1330021 RepID=A0A367LNT2_9HYPO|nr:hypothetical protein L249_1891 [Ophiocordyceps polyrhachis-furcata BCC 54312]
MPSDLEQLLDMGFEKARAEMAVKKSGGLPRHALLTPSVFSVQGALQWLEDNQDKSLEDIQAGANEEDDEAETKAQIAEIESGQARSLVCNDCGKRFRNQALASYHASKTSLIFAASEHTDFSESTEEIAPLTEEEKKAKLDELRERLKAKKAVQSVQDKEDQKRNEKIRQKATKETQDAKEELQRKEQMKEVARKRQEKAEDLEAKKRIKAKIEADKAERRRKADEAKAAREGRAPDQQSPVAQQPPVAATAAQPKSNRNEARLRLQTASGSITKTLPAETTLFELAQLVQSETGNSVASFSTTLPKKTFEGELDMSKTLKEAGLVPSSVLIVQ